MAAEQQRPEVAPTRSVTTSLKPLPLNKFKSHLMLDVHQRSRLFTEEEGKKRPADTDQHLAVCSMLLIGGKKSPQKKKKKK